MIREKEFKAWYYAPDFMKQELGDLFVGYEASARLTELAYEHPFAFETKREGKYRYLRMKFEDINQIISRLPEELSQLVAAEWRDAGPGFFRPGQVVQPPPVDKQEGPIKYVRAGDGVKYYSVPGSKKNHQVVAFNTGFMECDCDSYRFSSKKKCRHTQSLGQFLKQKIKKELAAAPQLF